MFVESIYDCRFREGSRIEVPDYDLLGDMGKAQTPMKYLQISSHYLRNEDRRGQALDISDNQASPTDWWSVDSHLLTAVDL